MYESLTVCTSKGQDFLAIRTHDLTGTDYAHIAPLTRAQAGGLALAGFPTVREFSAAETAGLVPTPFIARPAGEEKAILSLAGEDVCTVGSHIIALFPQSVQDALRSREVA